MSGIEPGAEPQRHQGRSGDEGILEADVKLVCIPELHILRFCHWLEIERFQKPAVPDMVPFEADGEGSAFRREGSADTKDVG